MTATGSAERSVLDRIVAPAGRAERVLHVEHVPPRSAQTVDWPAWVPAMLVDRLRVRGVDRPWTHQVAAAELAWQGRPVVLATGTASGKSLGYQLPVLSALIDGDASALYLAPTKALAADQLRAVRSLSLPQVRAAPYDGDTPPAAREGVRAHAHLLLTNPDMLHFGVLPSHQRWARFFRRLRYVVVDECHGYRGVF